jgi:hypothetical protein
VGNPPPFGLSRRALMRNGLLVGLGATVAVTALPALAGTALAEHLDETVNIYPTEGNGSFTAYPCQPDWWYCVRCFGIYHSDNDAAGGVCPAIGQHQNDTNYTNYCIPHDMGSISASTGGVQSGWRWCVNCQGLFWGSAAAESWCPAGGRHVVTTSAEVYDLPYGDPYEFVLALTGEQPPTQPDWLYCVKCRGLFYGHGGTSDGVCPKDGGPHSQYSGSSNYRMITYIPE